MKSAGIVRKTDSLGRIAIPKSLRERFKIKRGDGLEISIEGNYIILSKYRPVCSFCGSADGITEIKGKHLCEECLTALGRQAR